MLTQKAQDAIIRIHLLMQNKTCQGMREDEALEQAADALVAAFNEESNAYVERAEVTRTTLEDSLDDFMLQLEELKDDVRQKVGPEIDFLRVFNDFDMLIRCIYEYDYALCDMYDEENATEDTPAPVISETAGQAQFVAAALTAEQHIKTFKTDLEEVYLSVIRHEPLDGPLVAKLRATMSHIGQALGIYEDLRPYVE